MTIEIDHISLSVTDYEKAKAFYAAALAPMRISVLMEFPMDGGSGVSGLGADGRPFLWISGGKTAQRAHIALRAENEAQVDAFHAAAMAAGGTDNGAPGPRPHYHKNYYAAFVLDPDGNNIEAVIHTHGLPKPARTARTRKAETGRKAAGRQAAGKAGSRAASKKPGRRAAKKPAKRAAAKRPTTRKKPAMRGKKKAR